MPADIPAITPTAFICHTSTLNASTTSAHPIRLITAATIFFTVNRSPKMSRPRSTVNPADEYASTVATEAPFRETESVHNALNSASVNPYNAR